MQNPWLSLLLPSKRPTGRTAFLQSLAATGVNPSEVEVLIAVDAGTPNLPFDPFVQVTLDVPAGGPIPLMFHALAEHARGEFVMLCNDDLVFKTGGWADRVKETIDKFADRLLMVHLQEPMFDDWLCCFPILPRRVLQGIVNLKTICYRRYCLDPHLQALFDAVGRRVYLPDVEIEHSNFHTQPVDGMMNFPLKNGRGYYVSDPKDHAHDQMIADASGPRLQREVEELKALIQAEAQ